MATSYTPLLGLALPTDGELSGTWGQTVNNYITTYLDGAVAGTQIISGSLTAVTLSKTTGTTLVQAGATATGSSQYQIIKCSGAPASLLTVTVPAADKTYIVINATSTSQSVKIVGAGGAGPTTGVTILSGKTSIVAWNGTDFVEITPATATTATTATNLAGGGAGQIPYQSASGATAMLAAGTATYVLTSNGAAPPTWTLPASPGTGTVTSVAGTGTISGLTLSGTVTSSGSLTLGGAITGFLPLAGGTMTGNLTLDAYTEKVATLATSGSIALNPSTGTTLSCAAAGTVTFTDSLSSGQSISLLLTNGSSYTINWPTTTWVSAAGNTAPTLSASNTLVFWKIGTTLYGALVGKSA